MIALLVLTFTVFSFMKIHPLQHKDIPTPVCINIALGLVHKYNKDLENMFIEVNCWSNIIEKLSVVPNEAERSSRFSPKYENRFFPHYNAG